MFLMGAALFCATCPIGIEECTETVTITGFGDTFLTKKQVHFDWNGEDHWVDLEDGQRDMYEMLIGKKVVLSFGRVAHIVGGSLPLKDNEWRFVDISLPEDIGLSANDMLIFTMAKNGG